MTRKTGLQRRQNRSAAWKRFSPSRDPGKDTLKPAELPTGCRVLQGSQLCAAGSHARVDLVTGLHFQACSVCSKGPLTIIPSMPFQPFIGRSPPNAFEKRICFFLLFFYVFCLQVCVKVSDSLKVELQAVVNCHGGAGNRTQIL